MHTRSAGAPPDARAAFERDWRAARRMTLALGVAGHDADDVAQEALITVDRLRPTFRVPPGRTPAAAWRSFLRAVVERRVASHVRQRARRRAVEQIAAPDACDRGEPVPSAEHLALDEERRATLARALTELARTAPHLHAAVTAYLEGRSTPAVAATLGIPYGTACTRFLDARAALRKIVRRFAADEATARNRRGAAPGRGATKGGCCRCS